MKSVLCLLLLLPSVTLPLQAEKIPGLGTANFPTTTHSVAAQHEFIRGLLLLHVFEYPDAAKAFEAAQKLDPAFAMAYWGEAMTFNHPVWNELDAKAGQAALAKFAPTPEQRAARISDPRERAFMAAVEILYSGNGTKRERDALHATAMEKMSQAYPSDDEVQLFYSLALLGRSEGVRDVPTYLKAAAIAKAAYQRNPDHPGAAHYWIHGMDDPQHATGALEAARSLSKIAPDAGHAQHMCSHIFMALGMWDDVVLANVNGIRVVDEHARAAGRPVVDCGHYPIWLEYAYYQQGRINDGNRVPAECERTGTEAVALVPTRSTAVNQSLLTMRGISLIDTLDWNGSAATLAVDRTVLGAYGKAFDDFLSGYAAAKRGDSKVAQTSLAGLRNETAEAVKAPDADAEDATVLGILVQELNAAIAGTAGDLPGGITQAQAAAEAYHRMAFDFGPPVTIKPPDELLGELLLQAKRFPEARKAFEASLQTAPRRAESLLGLARSESAMGDSSAAAQSYGELLKIWHSADPTYPPLTEARKYLAEGPG